MRMKSLLAAVVTILVASAAVFAQADPSLGTWKLNVAKSKYNAGPPAPKSTTLVIEAAGKGVKLTSSTVLADGTSRSVSYTTQYDGKDAAVTGSPDYDAVAVKRTAAGSTGERKKGGKVVQTYTRSFSADGKTMTVTTKGTNAAGEKIDTVLVYEKQ